jgi:hypothetical protein
MKPEHWNISVKKEQRLGYNSTCPIKISSWKTSDSQKELIKEIKSTSISRRLQ